MKLYSFKRLIDKYSVSCQLVTIPKSEWKAGKKESGEPVTTDIQGAIVPMTEKRIANSGGEYKQGDCNFITTSPLELKSDTFIAYKDKKYKLSESSDYSDYADFYTYIAKGVSAFD